MTVILELLKILNPIELTAPSSRALFSGVDLQKVRPQARDVVEISVTVSLKALRAREPDN